MSPPRAHSRVSGCIGPAVGWGRDENRAYQSACESTQYAGSTTYNSQPFIVKKVFI